MELNKICKAYGEKVVLEDITLSLPRGCRACLMAPSGRGKTTLLRLLLGLEKPDSGSLSGVPARTAAVFQEDRLCKSLTVGANLHMALGKAYSEKAAREMLESLGIGDTLSTEADRLSGGMARRAALARALLAKPELLILDEPFTGLDDRARALCGEAIRVLPRDTTILLVTHREADAALIGADQIIRL